MKQPSNPPPPVIALNDRVLLCYAVLDESVGFRAGHGSFFVDGKEIGRVPCLAICEDRESSLNTLYFCDDDWQIVGVGTSYPSIDQAKQRAERIYPGSLSHWADAHFTADDVKRHLDEVWADEQCRFCGNKPYETPVRFFGTAEGVRICGDCVALFHGELNEPRDKG